MRLSRVCLHARSVVIRHGDPGNRGISLVEIMVALVIVGLALSFVMRTLPESNTMTTKARNKTIATNFVQEKLEELRALPYKDPLLNAGAHNDADNPPEGHFLRSWTVQENTPVAGMKQVSVTVKFPTASADSTVTISSILSSRL